MNILVAEDDYVSRLLVKKAIQKMEHQIIEAENGREAWDKFIEYQPGMIISDWMMPEMDGIQLCREIRSSDKKQYSYIIILTAKDKTSDLVEVFEAGADDYIVKPFRPDELTARIKTGERIIDLERRYREVQNRLVDQNQVLDQALADLKTTQSQVLQADKMASIGQLAAGIAHEINNPIGFISSNLEALKGYIEDFTRLLTRYQKMAQQLQKNGEIDRSAGVYQQIQSIAAFEKEIEIDYIKKDIPDLIKDCREGAARVGKIVGDLKSFAHPGNDKPGLVDINSALEATLNVVRNELKYKATVHTRLGNIPLVKGFLQKLNQVFINILVNAGQAIQEKGEIEISTRADQGDVEICISDTGCGIKEEHLSKVFDPFFTTKAVGNGTGLGMNIAWNIINEHRGSIQVTSAEGKGTTFTIRLPAENQ